MAGPFFESGGGDSGEEFDDDGSVLRDAYQLFKKTLGEAPVGADTAVAEDAGFTTMFPIVTADGDEDSEAKAKIYQNVMARRKSMQTFTPLHHWEKKPWADGQEASGIFQKSKFAACGASDEAVKHNKLMLFSAELYQTKEPFGSAFGRASEVGDEAGVWPSPLSSGS